MTTNFLVDTDSYKASHWLQYPPNTKAMFSYLEARKGGRYPRTLWYGVQALLKKTLSRRVTVEMVEEAREIFQAHGEPFNYEGWMYIAKDLGGKIPLRIRAIDEGTLVPEGFPLLSAESTDPKAFWVVSWFETAIMRLWYPVTVATQSYHIKQLIKKFLQETADTTDGLAFKLHDFGSRGVSSEESAGIGGSAHLVNFMGTDTVAGIMHARTFYNEPMAGFSIPASEHSSITSWGVEHEVDAYRNMLKQFAKPGALVACVSDSYDVFNAASNLWGDELKAEVVNSGATLIIRPDSGDPVSVINKLLYILDGRFGSVKNSKDFKVLNNVRIIQGDGVNEFTIEAILKSAKLAGFSADNIAFGMGGALLQQVNRDTQRFAFKCSEIVVDAGEGEDYVIAQGLYGGLDLKNRRYMKVPVSKNPVTDPSKASKSGAIGTAIYDGKFKVVAAASPDNLLKVRFENGDLVGETTFAQIRARANEA